MSPHVPCPMCAAAAVMRGMGWSRRRQCAFCPSSAWSKSLWGGRALESCPSQGLVRSEINYRDIRWYVRLDWTFPVDNFGAKARKEGRKQSRWLPWIKSFVSFFSGAATMPASCETRPPSRLLLSQTLMRRRGKPSIWTLVALACADEWWGINESCPFFTFLLLHRCWSFCSGLLPAQMELCIFFQASEKTQWGIWGWHGMNRWTIWCTLQISRLRLCQTSRESGCWARDAPQTVFTSSIPKFQSQGWW